MPKRKRYDEDGNELEPLGKGMKGGRPIADKFESNLRAERERVLGSAYVEDSEVVVTAPDGTKVSLGSRPVTRYREAPRGYGGSLFTPGTLGPWGSQEARKRGAAASRAKQQARAKARGAKGAQTRAAARKKAGLGSPIGEAGRSKFKKTGVKLQRVGKARADAARRDDE